MFDNNRNHPAQFDMVGELYRAMQSNPTQEEVTAEKRPNFSPFRLFSTLWQHLFARQTFQDTPCASLETAENSCP